MTSHKATAERQRDDDPDARRYLRQQEVFEVCRGLGGRERATTLEELCGDDLELRVEVEELLERAGGDEGLFSEPDLNVVRENLNRLLEEGQRPTRGDDWLPERIGAYRILGRIGAGGMGIVYEAEQDEPRRRVALKLIHPGQSSDARQRRFRQEAQILGRLNHPGIAQVHESGSFDLGRGPQPFFAMEFVEGVDLISYAEREALGSRARLELIASVADAVNSAHRAGVVHRDLKPDNVLVDTEGRPKVLDFGIAFAAEDSTWLSTQLTEEGQILGTLSYMAPEQLAGEPGATSPRADVYALGVIAFQLLTGELPLDPTGLPITAGMRLVANEDPRRLANIEPRLRGDVDTIVGKALEKDAARRYESAEAFAADIRRYLGDLPIAARPPSRIYRMRKFARRHKGIVATLITLVVGALVSTVLAFVARQQTRVAQALEEQVANHLYFAEMQLAADLAEEPTGAPRMQALLTHWIPAEGAQDRRGWEWHLLQAMSRPRETIIQTDAWVLTTEWHPTRELIVTGEVPARVFDVSLGEFVAELPTSQFSEDIAWSPSGDVAVLCGPTEARAFATDSWEELFVWNSPDYGIGVSWHPDGSHVLISARSGRVHRFDRGDWRARQVHHDPELFGGPGMIAHHPAGKELAILGRNRQTAFLVDLDTWEISRTLPPPEPSVSLSSLAWDPAGSRLAVGSADGHVQLWRPSDAELLSVLKFHDQFLTHLSWNPDGRRLASSCRDTSVQVVDTETGRRLRQLRGHTLISEYVDWDPRGERLVSGSKDGSLRIWPAEADGAVRSEKPATGVVHSPTCSWSPDGEHLATAMGGDIELWRPEGSRLRKLERTLVGSHCYWDHTGARIASDADGKILINGWQTSERTEVELEGQWGFWFDLAWHPSEPATLAAGCGQYVWMIELNSDPPARRVIEGLRDVRRLAWSLEGERLLVLDSRGLRLFDRNTGSLGPGPRDEGVEFTAACWSPDGSRVAAVLDDLSLRVWVVDGWREVHRLLGHNNQPQWCDWSPDGTRLASSDQDGLVKIWDAESGRLAATFDAGGGAAHYLEWSPNGEQLAVVTHERGVRVWNAQLGEGGE